MNLKENFSNDEIWACKKFLETRKGTSEGLARATCIRLLAALEEAREQHQCNHASETTALHEKLGRLRAMVREQWVEAHRFPKGESPSQNRQLQELHKEILNLL